MNKVKRLVLIFVAVFVLLFGAMTVYAVSGDTGAGTAGDVGAPGGLTDCMAEEMEVEAYYMNM